MSDPIQDIPGLLRFNEVPVYNRNNPFVDSTIKNMEPLAGVPRLNNWNDIAEYLTLTRQRKENVLAQDEDLRKNTGKRIRQNPYSKYNINNTSDLVDFFGKKNLGVKHRADWTSERSATAWLKDMRDKAKDGKQKAYWNNFGSRGRRFR
jgi:hypothetical protein